MLRALLFYPIFFPFTAICLILAILVSFVSPGGVQSVARSWARVCLWLAGVRVRIEGSEQLPATGPFICMANHSSNFDILALFAGLPIQFRWLAKEELFRIPLFGLAMKRSGYIPVDRGDRKKAISSMSEAAKRIVAGVTVVIFPEGTRSTDGRLLPFKKGGFMLALQAQVPIVPVVILGANDIMTKHSWMIRGGTIVLRIQPPVATVGKSFADRDLVIESVRDAFERQLAGEG